MRILPIVLVLAAGWVLLLADADGSADDTKSSSTATDENRPFLLAYPNLDDPDGEVVLSNEHVVLQRLVVPAGQWEGVHSHPGNQIYVHIRGGVWSGRLGGALEYQDLHSPDGEVGWMDAIPLSAGHNSGNTGESAIDLIYVTLKGDEPLASASERTPQAFPHVAAPVVFENDKLIVQRVRLEAGEWSGVHEHSGNQLYIHIAGGAWSERRHGPPARTSVKPGDAGWIDPIAEGHDIGNTGDTALDFVLVTLK